MGPHKMDCVRGEAFLLTRVKYRNLLFYRLVNFRKKNVHVKKFSDGLNWTKIILQIACGGH